MKKALSSRWALLLFASTTSLLCCLSSASQAGKEYNDSDKELNATYQKVQAIVTDPQDRRLFVEAQRSWIKFRDAEVAFHARYFPGSKGGLFIATDMIHERTEQLKILLTEQATQEHQNPFGKKTAK